MNARRIRKNMKEEELLLDQIKDTVYGSFIFSVLLLNGIADEFTTSELIKYFKKCKFPFMDDPDFLQKTWEEFDKHSKASYRKDLNHPLYEGLPLAVVESPFNTLIVPYIENTDEEVVCQGEDGEDVIPAYKLCPLNKGGTYNYTESFAMINGTWKPIDWLSKGESNGN